MEQQNEEDDHGHPCRTQPAEPLRDRFRQVHHGEQKTLLHTNWTGTTPEFVDDDWTAEEPRPCMYLHPYGKGEVLYLTLGHCRGKYDMQPMIEEYPEPEEGAWRTEEFYELLRRGIRWAMEA